MPNYVVNLDSHILVSNGRFTRVEVYSIALAVDVSDQQFHHERPLSIHSYTLRFCIISAGTYLGPQVRFCRTGSVSVKSDSR